MSVIHEIQIFIYPYISLIPYSKGIVKCWYAMFCYTPLDIFWKFNMTYWGIR